ncbi:MAG: DinB family protein [Nocardioides sp.]
MQTGELANYRDYLNHFRTTLERQCSGLSPAQLASRSVAPSTLSLLGLVRHLAYVEQTWFRRALQGLTDEPRLFTDPSDPDFEFNAITGTQEEVDEALAAWRDQIELADAWLETQGDETMGMELVTNRDGRTGTRREVLVHLIEEYARHAGHADLLREQIDGTTGL